MLSRYYIIEIQHALKLCRSIKIRPRIWGQIKGDELLVVRGDRGNGRKPNYFAINKDLDAARKDSKIVLTK